MLKKLIAWYKNRVEENDALRDKMFEGKEEQIIEEQEDYVPDISEPVLSFVETFKKNPRRFRLSVGSYYSHFCGNSSLHTLLDRFTGDSFTAVLLIELDLEDYGYSREWLNYPSFLTKDEWEYILESLSCYYKERDARSTYLRAARVTLMRRRERNRLTEIYKGGEDVGS